MTVRGRVTTVRGRVRTVRGRVRAYGVGLGLLGLG